MIIVFCIMSHKWNFKFLCKGALPVTTLVPIPWSITYISCCLSVRRRQLGHVTTRVSLKEKTSCAFNAVYVCVWTDRIEVSKWFAAVNVGNEILNFRARNKIYFCDTCIYSHWRVSICGREPIVYVLRCVKMFYKRNISCTTRYGRAF